MKALANDDDYKHVTPGRKGKPHRAMIAKELGLSHPCISRILEKERYGGYAEKYNSSELAKKTQLAREGQRRKEQRIAARAQSDYIENKIRTNRNYWGQRRDGRQVRPKDKARAREKMLDEIVLTYVASLPDEILTEDLKSAVDAE